MRYAALLLVLLLAGIGNAWGTDVHYVLVSQGYAPLTKKTLDGSYNVLKTDGTTIGKVTSVSSSITDAASLYYNSTSSTYANLTNTSKYGDSSTDNRTLKGINIGKGKTATINLGSQTFTKIDVIYRCNSSSAGTLTVAGDAVATSSTSIGLKSKTGTFTTSISISATSQDYRVVVILTREYDPSYTVTYDANGGSGTAPSDANTYEADDPVTVLGKNTLSKSGYIFTGWNTRANGTGIPYLPGETMCTGSSNATLYAQWDTELDLKYVWQVTGKFCDDQSGDNVASVNMISTNDYFTLTGTGVTQTSGSSLNVGKTANNNFLITAKSGYQIKSICFYGKIQDASVYKTTDGSDWSGTITSTSTSSDNHYTFNNINATHFGIKLSGTSGIWIRNMVVTIAVASSCTAPNHVDISGNWHFYPGETLEMTATAYSSAGTGDPIDPSDITGYQWQKYIDSDWEDIDGETSDTYTKVNATASDVGQYRCIVSTGATCSTISEEFDAKCLQLYVYWDDNSDKCNLAFTKVDDTHATATVFLENSSYTYHFKVTDGQNNWWGNTGTMTSSNHTGWSLDANAYCGLTTSKAATYTFNLTHNAGLTSYSMTVDYPSTVQTGGYNLYFANNERNWSNIHYRIGRSNWNSKAEMTLVNGTANLYKTTTIYYESDGGFDAWHIANNGGWSDGNSIYKTNTGDGNAITNATRFEGAPVPSTGWTIVPGSDHSTGSTGDNNNCEFYSFTTIQGMWTHTATISDMTNGSVRLNWTDVDGDAQSATSTTSDLAHTCNLQITAVPATGYDNATLTVNGSNFTSGNTHVLSANATIAATFTLHNYNVTYSAPSNGDYTIKVADGSASSASKTATMGQTITIVATPNTGYSFSGWTINKAGGGTVTPADASATTTTFTMPANDVTIVASFTAIPVSSITLSPTSATMVVGGSTQTITPTVSPSTALDKAITWTSSSNSVASVNSSGVVTAVAPGTATITATAHDGSGVTATCTITVKCTVTYDKNNGSATGSQSDGSSPYTKDARVTVKEQGTMALSNYQFVGWNTAANGSGTWYSPGANFAITANTTLNAQWRSTSGTTCPGSSGGTVFSLSMGSSVTSSDLSLGKGETKNLPSYATITNGSAQFTNVSTGSDGQAVITKASTNQLKYAGNDAMLTLYLDCALEEGDEISFTASNDVELSFTTSPTYSNSISTSSKSYTIPAESSLIGAHILYVWRKTSSTQYVTALTITRPADCSAPAAPSISGTTTWTVGDNISLTATCASGTDASTTYTWYKGATWLAASAETPVQAAATGSSGYTLTINSCDADDKGTYWCEASNGTGCEAHNTTGYTIDVPLGDDHLLIWYMTWDADKSDLYKTHSESSTSSYLGSQTTLATTGMAALGSDSKTDATPKLENSSSEDNTKCAYVTFTVADGYQFIPDSVILSTTAVGNDKNIVVELGSNKQTWAQTKSGSSTPTKHKYVFSSPTACTGTVTLKIHAYNSTKSDKFRIGSPIKIYGTVAEYTTYSVTYEDGDADEGSVPVDENSPYEAGETVTVLGNTGWLFKSGYNFEGWDSDNDGDVDYVKDGTFTMPSSDVTLTAVWGSCTKPGTPSRPAIEEGTLTHTGATFSWDPNGATDNSDGYVVSIVKVSDGSTVLDWTSEGIGSDVSATGIYHATGLEELTDYHFIVRAKGASYYCDYGDTARLTFTTLGTPYTITYHLNGASWINEGAAVYYHGTGYTLPVAGDMSNTGYTFGGWYDNSGLTGSAVTEISAEATGNKEFWAKWTENTYTVTYDKNGGSGDAMDNTVGHYVRLSTNTYTAPSGKIFVEWNTKSGGTGDSYRGGEDIELEANMTLYAIWADDYTISWGIVQLAGAGEEVIPNLGGGNYTITAGVGAWDGTLTTSMISAVTDGVTITNVAVDNSASPKTITATFNVGASVAGTSISLELDVPAYGDYAAKSSTKEITIDRCTGSSSGTDGVLFSAEFKDSDLGSDNICDAANTPYTFTTTELKAAPTGGSIKAYTTDNVNHMKFATNAISIAGSDGVIQIDLDNAIATNDLFTYVNVNSSTSAAYLRHTLPTNTTDQIALTGYNSQEKKVMLPAGYNGKTTLYIVRNNNDFKLHKAAVVRPAFLMLLRDDTPTSTTNLSGTDEELTTLNYLTTIQGGHAYYTSPSSGNLKIYRSSSKNYINFNNAAGYVKIVLNDALQEGDVIGFDSYNTNELALTITATRSTTIRTTSQLYTVGSSSALKGQTTFYLWQNSGSSDYLRGLQIARSGIAGGGGGTDKITPTLTWSGGLVDAQTVDKNDTDVDFTYKASQDKNSLGALTYSSSDATVATVNASGKVHILKAGTTTITANLAESGCYEEAEITYTLDVISSCTDVAGTLTAVDNGCDGVNLTVSGHTGEGVNTTAVRWYKDGVYQDDVAYNNKESITVTAAGEWSTQTTASGEGHCVRNSNSVTVTARSAASATRIVNQWYVKNGRRTPDIALVQTTNAVGFYVKVGDDKIWDEANSITTGFGGCDFYLGADGIIYLKGQTSTGAAPSELTAGDVTLKITATGCGSNSSELSIVIHKQAATTAKSVAFVVDGTKGGAITAFTASHATTSPLYVYLDSIGTAAGARKFTLTGRNAYWSTVDSTLKAHYSQFDIILITDDPNTQTVPTGVTGKDAYKTKGYINALGTLIDIRPILSMEAFVSRLTNWGSKGIKGNPTSPNPRQYEMRLQCKDHEIYSGLPAPAPGTHVWSETIGGEEYRHVIMIDSTKSPYTGWAYNSKTDSLPALQGFTAEAMGDLLGLGVISNGTLQAGIERQEEPAARLLLLGVNAKALPNALTAEGKRVISNALTYLLKTNMEEVDDCSNYFTGKTSTDWNTVANWSKGSLPNYETKVRILAPCEVSGVTAHVAQVDIVSSGESSIRYAQVSDATCNGKLTINANGALIVEGKVRAADAPHFATNDLKPTTVNDLVLNTSSANQAALIFNNDEGKTQATVNLYSLGRTVSETNQFQYFAIPMSYLSVNPTFANETHGITIYTYVWLEATGWERRGYYTDLYAFEGIGITTDKTTAHEYTMKGTLASTKDQEIPITADGKKLNLIGNSWTAPIQISELEASDFGDASSAVEQTVYIYCTGHGKATSGDETETAGQWLAIPFNAAGFGAWDGLKVIPSMQAFQIKTTGAGTLTLDYKKHVRGGTRDLTAKLRAPRRKVETDGVELMRIRVADSQTHTDLYLFEGDQFTDEFDNGWEANYRVGTSESAKLYARVATGVMSVAAMPSLESTPVYFIPGQETEYMFTFGGEGMGYYLNDIKMQRSTLISTEATYSFTYEKGDAAARFYISKTPIDAGDTPTGVSNTEATPKAQKIIYDNKLYIIVNGALYDATGKKVNSK